MAEIRYEPPALDSEGSAAQRGAIPAPRWYQSPGTLLASGMEVATVVTVLLLVVSVSAGVFCRYVLRRPLAGVDEVATLGLVWLTFLGGAVAQRRHAHPRVSFSLSYFVPAAMVWVDAITRLVEILFFLGVCWQSLVLFRLRIGEASAGAGFDMSLYPLAVLIGVTVTGLFAIGHLATLPWRVLRTVLAVVGGLGAVGALVLYSTGWSLPHLPPTGLLLVGFPVLLLLNVPLAVALGFPALLALQGLGGANLLMLPQRLIAGVDNFVLLAIPLFLLAGGLMETGGISRRLVALAQALVGHLRGGLGHVTVVGEILFSGISGSTTADVAILGTLLLPAMEREGYRRAEAIAIVSAAAAIARTTVPSVMGTVGLYLGVLVVGLLIVAFVPWITLVLPAWFLGPQ